MPEEYMNIYKTARRNAGITQEAAAEQLGISVESVRAYQRACSGNGRRFLHGYGRGK